MTVSSVSSAAPAQPWQQVRNDYQTLNQALAQGDVTAAQKAYASIQQDQQNGPQPPANSPAAQDFTALGQALQNGDLDSAKQAFSSLQADFQKARQTRGAGGHSGGKGAGHGDDSADAPADKTIASQATTTNANGTLTVTTTYTDGSTSSEIQPNPAPTVSQSPLAAGNSGQLATLLSAQEQQALLQPAQAQAAGG